MFRINAHFIARKRIFPRTSRTRQQLQGSPCSARTVSPTIPSRILSATIQEGVIEQTPPACAPAITAAQIDTSAGVNGRQIGRPPAPRAEPTVFLRHAHERRVMSRFGKCGHPLKSGSCRGCGNSGTLDITYSAARPILQAPTAHHAIIVHGMMPTIARKCKKHPQVRHVRLVHC